MKPDRQDNKNGSGPNNSKKNLTGFLFIVLWAVVIFFGIRLFASSLSGGSSAGVKDVAVDILAGLGEVFFHGLAMKPGKPTIAGRIGTTPVFALPGHPVAAYFVFQALVRPLLLAMQGSEEPRRTVSAVLEQLLSGELIQE